MSDKTFIYWDNSNISVEARRQAEEREASPNARTRVQFDFDNMLRLAHADRPIGRAVAAGAVPPEIRVLWNRMENRDVEVALFDGYTGHRDDQEIPDGILPVTMLEDGFDNNGNPGIAVFLTGEGLGYSEFGFQLALECLSRHGWGIEVLSWRHACNQRMRAWAEDHGVFVALDDFYESITFLEPSRPGHELARSRDSAPLDLTRRAMAHGGVK